MTPQEAYSILGLSETSTDEELKTKHKELVFQFHPDRNKAADPNKLSEINSAYQFIQDFRAHPEKYQQKHQTGFYTTDIGDLFSNFFGGNNRASAPKQSSPPPQVDIVISFRESILGCQKTIAYKRHSKCNDCEGKGLSFIPNGCKETGCNGFGKIIQNRPGMSFQTICGKCQGRGVQNKKCATYNVKGYIEQDVSTSITVPPGVPNDITMELPHAGHFAGGGLFGDQYSSVHIRVNVEPSAGLELVGQDVVSRLTIPLVDALTGQKTSVPTIDGLKEITIEPLTRHQQEIILPSLGVSGKGNQRVIVNVEYPTDVSKLIEVLKG
jgi:molecular chaperone DnaJ